VKYGRRIVREAIDRFPYREGATRKDLLMVIKGIKPSKEGIFGQSLRWRVKIHYILSYIKISYYPLWPYRKGRIYFRQVKENEK
jgi:hypothetical protein